MSPSKKLTRRSTSDAGLASRLSSALARDAEAQLAAAARVRHRYEMGSKTKAYEKDFRMLQADADPTDALIRRKEIRGGFETAYLRKRDAPAAIGESQFRLEKVEQATESGVMVRRFDEHGKLIEALKQSPDQTELEHWQVDTVGELRRVYFRTMHRGAQLTDTLSDPDANGDRVLARSRNGNTHLFVLNSDGFIQNYGPQARNRDPYASTLVNAPVPGKITLKRGFIRKKVVETYYDGSRAIKNYRLGSKRNETRLPPNPPYANRAPLYQSSNLPPPPYHSPANSPRGSHIHTSAATGPSDPRAVGMPNMSPEAQAALAVVDAAEAAKVARNHLQIAEDHALAVKLQLLDAETDMHLGGAAPSQSLQHDAATLTTQATDAVLGSLRKLMPSTDLTALRQTLRAALMPILSQVEFGGITTQTTSHSKTGASSNFSYSAPLLGPSSQASTGVGGSRDIDSFTSSAIPPISGHVNPLASLASSSRLAPTTTEPNTLNGGSGVRMAPSTLQSDLDALKSQGSAIRNTPQGDERLNGGSSSSSALGSTHRPSLLDRINSGGSNNSEPSKVTALGHRNLSDFLNGNQSGDDKALKSAEASSAKSAPVSSASRNEGRPSLLERVQGPVGIATEPSPAPGSLGDIFNRINSAGSDGSQSSKVGESAHGDLSNFMHGEQSEADKAPKSAEAPTAKAGAGLSASSGGGRTSPLERVQVPAGKDATEPPALGSLGDIFNRINEQSTPVKHSSNSQEKTTVSTEPPLLRKVDSTRDYPLPARADLLARKGDVGHGL